MFAANILGFYFIGSGFTPSVGGKMVTLKNTIGDTHRGHKRVSIF